MLNVTESAFKKFFNLFQTKMGLNSTAAFSIFQYSNEFQDFLNENSDDLSNVSTISISNLLKQDFLEKLQEEEEKDETDTETEDVEGTEETEETAAETETEESSENEETNSETPEEENSNFFEDFMLELFKDENFANSVDKNQNGKTDFLEKLFGNK